MATIASLVVSIGADIADLKVKASEAERTLTSGIGKMNSALDAFKATAVFGAVVKVLGDVAAAADEIDGFAARINDTASAVQRLQAIAEAGDAEMGAIVASIQKLQAGLGSGKIDGPLRAIGIEVDKFKQLSGSEQYAAMAEALGKISDPAERAAHAQDILGKGAAAVAGTFKEGIGDIDRWVKMSDETVSALDRLGINFANVKASLTNLTAELLMNITQLRTFLKLWDDWIAKPTPPALQRFVGVGADGKDKYAAGSGFAEMIAGRALPGVTTDGQSFAFIEKQLTSQVEARIRTEQKAADAAEKLAAAQMTLAEQMQARTNFALSRGGMFGANFGQNVAGVGVGTFPGFALPFADLASSSWMSGATFNGTGFGMLRPGVESALSGGSGGGGLMSFLQGRGGALLGGVGGMLTGLIPGLSGRGSSIGSGAGAAIGALVGGPLAPILGPLGGLAGGLLGKLFGGGEGRKTNDARDAFTSEMGGIQELNRLVVEAGGNLDKFFAAKTQTGLKTAIEEINALLDDQDQLHQRGIAAMEKYGITAEQAGQKFKQTQTNMAAEDLVKDFQGLVHVGVDLDTIIEKMGGSVGAFVQRAIEMGTSVPREMEPIIARMIETGSLVDANGDKFTELSQVPFADSLNEGMAKLITKLDLLLDKIGVQLPKAITNIPDGDFTVTGRVVTDGDFPGIPAMAKGGIVTRPTLALIGEAGPEAVVPLRGGAGRGLAGGINVTVNVDASGSLFDGYSGEQALVARFSEAFANAVEQQRRLGFAGV